MPGPLRAVLWAPFAAHVGLNADLASVVETAVGGFPGAVYLSELTAIPAAVLTRALDQAVVQTTGLNPRFITPLERGQVTRGLVAAFQEMGYARPDLGTPEVP